MIGIRKTGERGGGRGRKVEQVRCSRGMTFPGVITIPATGCDDRDKRLIVAEAERKARAMGEDTSTI